MYSVGQYYTPQVECLTQIRFDQEQLLVKPRITTLDREFESYIVVGFDILTIMTLMNRRV